MERKVIPLEIIDDVEESGVSKISLVDTPAIEKDWMAFKRQEFVEPNSGERETDFIPRCIAYNVNEGKDKDQAAAICYSVWENHAKQFNIEPNPCWEGYEPYGLKDDGTPNCIPVKNAKDLPLDLDTFPEMGQPYTYSKVSFDYDDTLSTGDGLRLAIKHKDAGDTLYIISARNKVSKGMLARAKELGIPTDRVFATGSNEAKVAKVKELAIAKHIDNNADVVKELGATGLKFDYVLDLPAYTDQLPTKKKEKFANPVDSITLDVPLFLRLMELSKEDIKNDVDLHKLAEKAAGLSVDGHVLTMGDYDILTSVIQNTATTTVNTSDSVTISRGQTLTIVAGEDTPQHGLLVQLMDTGGYDVKYWYNTVDNVVPQEVKVDGEPVSAAATSVYLGYHTQKPLEMKKQFFASEDQQIVVGPAMIPDMEIPRIEDEGPDKGKPYWVSFSKEVVKRIAEKFMRELRNHNTNIQHEANSDGGSYVMETWLVENEEDKANSLYGFEVPIGTWMVKMRVVDPAVWKAIKAGKLNGFSIEGNFMSEADYAAYQNDKQLYDRVMKILKSV